MKKLLISVLILTIILLSGCNNSNSKGNNDTPSPKNEQTTETDKNTNEQENNKTEEISNTVNNKNDSTDSNSTNNTNTVIPIKPNTSTTDTPNTNEEEKEEEEETTTTPSTTPTPIVTPLGEVAPDAVCYQLKDYGTIEDWFTADDLIFLLCKNPNYYILIDSNTGEILTAAFLPGRPIEFHLFGDEFWISFPDLKCIKVYDANSWALKKSITFSHNIGAFDVCGDYIIYAEDKICGSAYRYNMKTTNCVEITTNEIRNFSLNYADVLIDAEQKTVYIGDSYGSIAYLYCFDIETLSLKTYYDGSKIGWGNLERRTFLIDNKLYWSGRVFDPYNLTEPLGQYHGYGTHHVDEYFVITTFGVFIRESGEQLLAGSINSVYSAACITASGNLMVNDAITLYIIPA